MSQSQFIVGGKYVPPQAWIEEIKAAGYEVELPPGDPRPLIGGDFSIRFRHADVTQGQDAWIEVFLKYRGLARNTPPQVLQIFEKRLKELIHQKFYSSPTACELATSIGWVQNGRDGALFALKNLKDLGFDIDVEMLKFWNQPDAHQEQIIEFCAYGGLNIATLMAEDVIARGIAKASGAVLNTYAQIPCEDYLKPELLQKLLKDYQAAPRTWNMSQEVTAQFLSFIPFPGWDEIFAEENFDEDVVDP